MGTIGYIVMAISYMVMAIWPLVTWILVTSIGYW